MRRMLVLLLGLLLLLASSTRAEDNPRLAEALALQQALEDTIATTEPAIACILVSRSEEYKNWAAAPPAPENGKLGDFTTERRWSELKNFDKADERRIALLALDLAHPDHHPESYGSGVVIDGSGLVLTMAHVVRGATKVYVRLPNNQGSYADIHALDPRSDLAVLKLLHPPKNLKALPLGDGGKLRKGQFVLLLANPYAAGFRDGSPSASLGMIANLRRRAPGLRGELDRNDREKQTLHHYGTLLQIDTRLTLGSSGGALLNLKGELVGISTALAALTGVESPGGFAVPLDAGLRRVVECLKRGEEVEYGFLGVRASADSSGDGVVIELGEQQNSPALSAGLTNGDRILSINGQPVRTNDDLFLLIGTELAGSTVRVQVEGPKGKRICTAQLAKYYYPVAGIAANRPPARFGLRVDYTSTLDQRNIPNGPFGRRVSGPGVVIREVLPHTSADKARLQADKIITAVDGKAVASPAQYYEAIKKAGGMVRLTIINSEGQADQLELQDN